MGKQVTITNGAKHWSGSTKAATEAARDKDLNRLFSDLDWEPIVMIMPHRVMVGAINWAGNWEYSVHWVHETDANSTRGCTVLAERNRHQVKVAMHRHASQYVRDVVGEEAGLAFVLESDDEGREGYLQTGIWQSAYRTAFKDSKDDTAARLIADQAQQQFAERVDRLPIRQLETALSMLQAGQPVPVTRAVWAQAEAQTPLSLSASQYLVLKDSQQLWCHKPQVEGGYAWLNQSGVAGYLDQHRRLCLLQLKETDAVVIAPKGKATYGALAARTEAC